MAKKAGLARHILDRFHIMAHLSKAIVEVRAHEAHTLRARGRAPVLTHARWLLLTRPAHLTDTQPPRLAELLAYNLRAVRAYRLKEEFQFFWTYLSPPWAGRFLDRWCTQTLRSRLAPMQKVARMLRRHRPLLLNWFRAKGAISGGAVEGFTNKTKLTMRRPKAFAPTRPLNSRSITLSASDQNPKVIEPIFEADFDEAAYGYRPSGARTMRFASSTKHWMTGELRACEKIA